MASELNYFGRTTETGLTVVAQVFTSAGTQVGADITCTEAGTLAIYIADMPTAALGQYGVRFIDDSDGSLLGQGFINWDGSKECELNSDKSVLSLNDFNPASDTVANVTLVATTTANTDMRGTDSANTVAPNNASITSILADTNELQTNQGDWATADVSGIETKVEADARQVLLIAEADATQADIAALNDFDPTSDAVANVTLVATTTTNSDMRGTDGANTTTPNTVAPDNTSIAAILIDTNDLQTNQGNFATATGFSTPTNVTDAQTAIIAEIDDNEAKIDTIDTIVDAIKVKTDTLVNTDLTGIALTTDVTGSETVISNLIAALNDISAAEVNTEVDTALSDYDGPTKAELDAAETAILSAISSGSNDLSAQDIWDYLQTETTVSDSMKEAVQITLKNSKLIPAAL